MITWQATIKERGNFTKAFGYGEIVSCGDYII